MSTSYIGRCSLDGCSNAATRMTPHGPLCDAHRKRTQPSRAGKTPLTAPVKSLLSPRDRLRESALAYAEAPDPEEDDRLFRLIDDRLAKAAVGYATELRQDEERQAAFRRRRAIKRGQMLARQAGKRIGPPTKLTFEQAYIKVQELGSVVAAAEALGVARNTVSAALRRKPRVVEHGEMHTLAGPLSKTGSAQKDEETHVEEQPKFTEEAEGSRSPLGEGPERESEGETSTAAGREGGLQGDAPSSSERPE